MMNVEWKERLNCAREEVNGVVTSYLPEEEGPARLIFEAMNYSVLNGGKRIRPLMMRESFRAFGGNIETEKKLVEPFMAAIEMIHSYSLVHDDLPEMDNDMYRRGKLTTHAAYGQDVAVLAGDGLLNYAYETAVKACMSAKTAGETAHAVKALQILGTKAGVYGMVGGQTVDVTKTGQALSDSELAFIYELKTAALLEASLMIGAILAGASEDEVEKIGRVANKVGVAFQIKDDILDETSTKEMLGKPIHSDLENNKTTYVTLHGLSEASIKVEELTKEARMIMDELNLKGDFLRELLDYLVEREN
ncbi:MAG: polyprenyl synthetase family protein [Lachnospiraceae bacterium]